MAINKIISVCYFSDADKQGKRRVFRRADTNVVSLRFDTLKTPSAMHAGEVILCSDCEAIMSHVSEIKDDGPDKVKDVNVSLEVFCL